MDTSIDECKEDLPIDDSSDEESSSDNSDSDNNEEDVVIQKVPRLPDVCKSVKKRLVHSIESSLDENNYDSLPN